MHICLHISTVAEPGGAQRVLTQMANFWAEHGTDVTVLTTDEGCTSDFNPINPAVKIIGLNDVQGYAGLLRAASRNIGRILRLRSALKSIQPSVVIAYGNIPGMRAVFAGMALKIPIIIFEHIDPAQLASFKNGLIWDNLRKCIYPLADLIVVLNETCKRFHSKQLQERIMVIPNAVPNIVFDSKEDCEVDPIMFQDAIVAVGRLVTQKRLDALLHIFASIRHVVKQRLVIVGDGECRESLESQAELLHMRDRVVFTGYLKQPWSCLRSARVLVMTSDYEGFPMTLLEAMAIGLPVISYDCPTGPSEIIRDGVDGFLIPHGDRHRFAAKLVQICNDEELCRRLSANAPEIKIRFGLDHVMSQWNKLLEDLTINVNA